MASQVVIIGGGIIGCTTAYYVTHHPSFTASTVVTVLEASNTGIAQGASGKAGLTLNGLVNVTFSEHEKLAREHGGEERWGWRYVGAGSWRGRGEKLENVGTGVGEGGKRKSLEKTNGLPGGEAKKKGRGRKERGLPHDLDWVREDVTQDYSSMAKAGETAQFTESMMSLATEKGAKLIQGKAREILVEGGRVKGVLYEREGMMHTIEASHIVLSAGAWCSQILPQIPMGCTRAHSITLQVKEDVSISPYALFTEIQYKSGGKTREVSPEIYARPHGELYACGPGDDLTLPEDVDRVQCDLRACESIRDQVCSISDQLSEATVTARQACYLPVLSSGEGPIVGEATRIAKGLVIAAGHTCWGICNAPGTAKAVSELVMEGEIKCADLSGLHPSNFGL
ncbi:hypothetical protein PROFUN_12057 [Planoprotostelium fungivorum]|uniref:FAD dependent oxidoreductase domain-containing protein n=1 Tax=Planoprotostelium fungivorum TaxID=1890364 RepID=A0A2P6MXK8_9EUKA|nr:hypothetical protein PROFUN_12057 [Planoprotostelium fungivorum]